MKYFLQYNELYIVEGKIINDNEVGGKSEIQLSLEVSERKETSSRFDFDNWGFIKDGSILESRIEDLNLKSFIRLFKNYFKVNSEKFMK